MASAAAHQVEVTEDIVSGNGVKLLAKGARVDANTHERLLRHKLSRPLEACLGIADGVSPSRSARWPSNCSRGIRFWPPWLRMSGPCQFSNRWPSCG